MTRIVIDIANAFNENVSSFNIAAICPSYSYLVYRAGMHVLLTADISNKSVQQNFYELRRCCWYFSHRWLVASLFPCIYNLSIGFRKLTSRLEIYFNTLEISGRALEITLPYLGEFVRPNVKLPGQ